MVTEPIITPASANGFPPYLSGSLFICDNATNPIISAAIPGTGPKQPPVTTPAMAVIIDAIANPVLACLLIGG